MGAYYVYILASKRKGTLYTGFTRDLITRVYQHKTGQTAGFTKKYRVHKLVYFEQFDNPWDGIEREKQIKKWRRKWKLDLIESMNPDWEDLYEVFCR